MPENNSNTDTETTPDINETIPTPKIIEAFGATGDPLLLEGGQGTCYMVQDLVLKPTHDPREASWIADINNRLESPTFRVPKPIKAQDGSWVFQGWTANQFLEGKHKAGQYDKLIKLSQDFHQHLADEPKPTWFDSKIDVFAISDKIAWGELPLPAYQPAAKFFEKIIKLLKPNQLPNQLVHGDWGPGQILFHDALPPAIIDMTPYFRPANYPIADMLLSAIKHEGAAITILDLGQDLKDFDQLLLRALLMRTCTYIGFQTHPENDRDWTSEISNYIDLADALINKIK